MVGCTVGFAYCILTDDNLLRHLNNDRRCIGDLSNGFDVVVVVVVFGEGDGDVVG